MSSTEVATDVISLSSETTKKTESAFVPLSAHVQSDIQSAYNTIRTLLSASESLRTQFNEALTGTPTHPYEKLKYNYGGKDFHPLTLNDIQEPVNFCCTAAVQEISAISDKFYDIADTQIRALSCDNLPNECNSFAILSGDQFVLQPDKLKNHINFLEFVKHIPIPLIESNPHMVAKKILYYYTTCYR